MIKSILVFTDGSESGTTACRYAIALAKGLGAELTGCHVLDSRMLEGPLMADISGWIGAQPFSGQLKQFRDLLQQKGEAVVEALVDLAKVEGIEIEVTLKMGHPARVLLDEEVRAEMIVLGRHGEHREMGGGFIGSIAERVSRHSVKPCLIAPDRYAPIEKILCGFDGSPYASKALHEAIELALVLQKPLVILSIAENADLRLAREWAEDGIRMARAHECAAANLVLSGQPDVLIPQKADELNCGLIVVGAYGHSRIRELILGSTTHSLIARSTKPILLVR